MAKAAIWRERVREWRASGETAADFAVSHGYSVSSLRWWAWKLGESATSDPPSESPRLVRVLRGGRARDAAASDAARITIELGAARVTVKTGADRTTLREVLNVLGNLAKESDR